MGKRNLVAVGVGAVNVVEAHRNLGDDFQLPLACLKNLSVNRIAQGRDQPVNPRLHLFDDQALRRRLRLGVDFNFISTLTQEINRIPDVTGCKDTNCVGHGPLWLEG